MKAKQGSKDNGVDSSTDNREY